jgi:hypothetical protein
MKIMREPIFSHNDRGFSVKLMEWDVCDYMFNIQAFGRDFGCLSELSQGRGREHSNPLQTCF